MKKYTPVIVVMVMVAVWYLFIGKELLSGISWQNRQTQPQKIAYEFPCSEANLARIIGNTLGEMQDHIDEALWYEPYYQQLSNLGVTCLNEDEAFNIVSSDKLATVLTEITGEEITLELNEQMNLYEVIEIYKANVKKGKPVSYQSLTIMETPDTGTASWQVETDKGVFNFEGLIVESLKNQKIEVAYIDNALLGVMALDYSKDDEIAKEAYVNLDTMRVLLSNEKGSYDQEDVFLISDYDYDVVYKDVASELKAGVTWKASDFKFKNNEIVTIVPRSETSQITVLSLEKNNRPPKYYGILEITKVNDHYEIINEVDIEQYVAGVLPSEMPTSYGEEALKAQAIAIRTYGISSKQQGKFQSYGADVDDTTASQVYNRIEPDELAETAATATAGLVLLSNGEFINNKFFASSCGYTANYGEVWADDTFPSKTPNYLIAEAQYLDKKLNYNMQKEEEFDEFIKLEASKVDAFDASSPWFRWQVTLTGDELEKLIKPALKNLSEKYANRITYENDKKDIGSICELIPLERGEGGNLMRLKIVGTKGSATVETEYVIRSLFASNNTQNLTVTRANDTKAENLTLLPSAFFALDQTQEKNGTIENITIYGGGNGHGVGMSQDGAKGMANKGYDYEAILQHYYRNSDIVSLATLLK